MAQTFRAPLRQLTEARDRLLAKQARIRELATGARKHAENLEAKAKALDSQLSGLDEAIKAVSTVARVEAPLAPAPVPTQGNAGVAHFGTGAGLRSPRSAPLQQAILETIEKKKKITLADLWSDLKKRKDVKLPTKKTVATWLTRMRNGGAIDYDGTANLWHPSEKRATEKAHN